MAADRADVGHNAGKKLPLRQLAYFSFLLALVSLLSATGASLASGSSTGRTQPVVNSAAHRTAGQTQQERITQQQPPAPRTAAIEGIVQDENRRPIGGANVTLRNVETHAILEKTTSADGVFRFIDLPPAKYELKVEQEGFQSYDEASIAIVAGQVIDRNIALAETSPAEPSTPQLPQVPQVKVPPAASGTSAPPAPPYSGVLQGPQASQGAQTPSPENLPPPSQVFQPDPDRWLISMPTWDRYGTGGEHPYVKGRRWDPFDRNKLKGDYPIFGKQTFLDLTAVSDTFFDGRRLPTPTDVSTAHPGEPGFFGKGGQKFLDQVFLFSFDLSHGDASFRPVDWRIRVTPVISLNYLNVRELGVVNIDVRAGTSRLDSHIGLQEAFAEVKLADLSPNYDFISVRAGIQEFTSDFRGFLFVEEQPGLRIFGNLESNRWQYNLAYFNFLEKNTNSGINSMALRNQQVIIANVYRQDFLRPGYTAQFSVHYNIDQATIHFDDNGFLVRPAPIGAVVSGGTIRAHSIHAVYLGWTGDGHIGRLNITHAFYQAFGNDSFNPIAARPVTINAQLGAIELSVDKDWARFKISSMYASGSGTARDGRATGFDSIEDFPEFAGGIFSLWNREGIRLTGTGVALTPRDSILPDLRSSKDEGQANFVNPGIFLFNLGTDLDVTPKVRLFINANYLQFVRTEPLELLLFQGNIHRPIGYDYSAGVRYRPPLSENISITAGAGALTPGQGFKDIYTSKTLFSVFGDVRFQF